MATPPSDPNEREIHFLKAQLAHQARRHDHAARFMMHLAKSVTPSSELSPPERKLLRSSLQKFLDDHYLALCEIRSRTIDSTGKEADIADFYMKRISREISSVCREIKRLIVNHLIPSARSAESRVFYLTLQGDVSSYIVVLNVNEDEEDEELAAIFTYRQAKLIANTQLTWLNPVRLMLALKTSEFYANVVEWTEKGVKIANKAVENAMKAGAGHLVEGELKNEINDLMEKLRDNIVFWTASEDEQLGSIPYPSQLAAGISETQVASTSEINIDSRTQPFRQSEAAATSVITAAAAAATAAETSDSKKATKRVCLRDQKQ